MLYVARSRDPILHRTGDVGGTVMQRPGVSRLLIAKCAAAAAIATCLCAGAAWTQTRSASYVFLVASGFLCDPNNASACTATAKADPGDSYEMSGAGTFDAETKSVQAAGTFAHKSTNGHVLETGVWLASELVSFNSYGAAPGALPQEALGFRSMLFGAKRSLQHMGAVPTGGLAVFQIRLLSLSGAATDALLEVNSALGQVPSERSIEGIRLTLADRASKFSEVQGSRVMFLSMRLQQKRDGNPGFP